MNRHKPPWWSQRTAGCPIGAVVCVHQIDSEGREDLLLSRNSVAVVRPSAVEPKPGDEHKVDYLYGPDTTTRHVHDRTVEPLLHKFVEGYNTTAIMFGSTGTGKTSLLEGRNGIAIDDDSTKTPGQEGLVQLISASLFDLLEEKQLSTGDKVAARRRLYQARGFEYFVDCTYVELFNESCSDLLRPEGQLVKDEDAATVSRLHVVDMAGAERLLVDPELLRQREGTQVNQSLLTFATILRKLAQGKPSHSVNQDASVLTKLLSEALGGNCLTTMI
ncbi:hypothetical protein WJX79_002340, partial [Trebouxia sp. C0005]